MRGARLQPTGVERTFGDHEIIVSKTDTKGRIEYPNDVFSLMWETIGKGQEIFAYANNLAADGSHYWVLAHITSSYRRGPTLVGYHSNRRSPDWAAGREADLLYRGLRAEGLRHPRPADALAASTTLLVQALADRGQTYEEYVWSLISSATVGA